VTDNVGQRQETVSYLVGFTEVASTAHDVQVAIGLARP
jgi:hypothetical protein